MTGYLYGLRVVYYLGRAHSVSCDYSIGSTGRFCYFTVRLEDGPRSRSIGYGRAS